MRPLMERFPVVGITEEDLRDSMADKTNWQNCYKHHLKTVRRNELTKAVKKMLFERVDPCYRGFFHRWLGHSQGAFANEIPGGIQLPHTRLQNLADTLFGDILEGTNDDFREYIASDAFKRCGLRIHLHHTCLSDGGHYDAANGAFSPYLFMEQFFAIVGGECVYKFANRALTTLWIGSQIGRASFRESVGQYV